MLHRRVWILAVAAAAAFCLASGSEARAAVIEFQFGSVTSVDHVIPDSPAAGSSQADLAGVGSFPTPGGTSANAGGTGTDIVVATVAAHDLGVSTDYTDTYGAKNGGFSVTVAILDVASGVTKDVVLSGTVTGTISRASDVGSTNLDTPFSSGPQVISFANGDTYTVSFKNFNSPGPAPSGAAGDPGKITFHVVATSAVPEPSTLALAGIGGLGAIGFIRRRRRMA
jgi:hypothetical protein